MIAIGSDHGGFEYKEKTKILLSNLGLEYKDFGTFSNQSCDYPDYAHQVAKSITSGESEIGILICGSGIGMSIAANKHKNIRAAVCESTKAAELSRKHNNANILCFGQRFISWETAEEIIKIFLNSNFEGGRHENRVNKINL